MLHIRVVAASALCRKAEQILDGDPATTSVVRVNAVTPDGSGDLLLFDVAREDANRVIDLLKSLGIEDTGSISLSEPLAVLSYDADRAETAIPGHPDDGVVWGAIEERAEDEARPSWSFFAFLTLATLLAGIGRYLDEPILIVGAMVVGPEFAPISALSLAVARRRPGLIVPASITLIGGLIVAIFAATVWWSLARALGVADETRATTGLATDFIIKPDGWSFVVALLAGCAGVLSLTAAKSSALVGVFISVTTIPAIGTIGLTMAFTAWDETRSAAAQLMVNLAGLLLAGILTLVVQTLTTRRREVYLNSRVPDGR